MFGKLVAALMLVAVLSGAATTAACARAGQSADDCPPNSKDPDCAGK